MTQAGLTRKSSNVKTGPIPVSTTSSKTCPAACPFRHDNAGGCYAQGGPMKIHWDKITRGEAGSDWAGFCEQVRALPKGQLWRHNQAGDLPGEGDGIDLSALLELIYANKGKRGFTYTHKPVDEMNTYAIKLANDCDFTVNLSANNPAHADELSNLDIGPVVTVLPDTFEGSSEPIRTPQGRMIAICPATYRDDVTCASCALCQRQSRKVIVGFPAHGYAKKRASAIAAA